MNRKLRSIGLAAAAAATLTAVPSGTASAETTTTCKPAVNIFTMQADGDLWLYKHTDPVNGGGSWGGAQQVGWGWGGKTFAGKDGRLYNITTGGELRRLRYNGSGWDTMPGGGQYETIGWGWQRYLTERNKITVDADGQIYTLEGDQLRRWAYNEELRQWVVADQVIDVGWSRFNMIVASGQGGLQARDGSGALHRFRFKGFYDRFQTYDVIPATQWPGYDKFFSAGGDVYYAVRPDTGQLLWNRFTEEDATSNWRTSTGSVIGWDWGTDVDITATTTDCTVNFGEWGAGVRNDYVHPAAIMTPNAGGTHIVNINSDNRIIDTYSTGSGWATRDFGQRYSGPSRSVVVDDTGSAVFATTNVSLGSVELHTLKGDQWQTPTLLKGGMDWTPALTRRSNGTLALYAAGDFYETTRGRFYVREQQANGEWRTWRPFGNRTTKYIDKPVVITRGDETTIAIQTWIDSQTMGPREWFRHTPGNLPVRMGTLPRSDAQVVFSLDGRGGILAFSALNVGGTTRPAVLREKADRSGFEDNWQVIDGEGGDGVGNGGVDALLLPNGTVALSRLDGSGRVSVTTSVAPGSTQFHPWRLVSSGDPQPTFGYPTSLAMTRTGELALAASDNGSDPKQYLWTAPVPSDPATPPAFTGGRVK
ncbi:hypothetical protein Lesp02_62990 [Lentzea sp. NBRC 105346]|uniref:tachylectin-related carbohydrate-binding protein n=1 Tax=Lentzea sp. NBRC 105346 TaxID=3032205 RepID=UPI00249FA2B9|nr:tachylectin-related carbohydrate-binding protein [Lentzea sp. NBRC 105346]GLZ34112.1 hypothetical protein Lesp02_62990 [Lentzea sp. NBRC 105346]